MFARARHPCVSVPPALSPALPLLLKNSREYFPERAKCLGIQPSSSMMWAMWSIKGGKEAGKGRGGKKKKEKDTNKRKKVDAKEIKDIYRRKRGKWSQET